MKKRISNLAILCFSILLILSCGRNQKQKSNLGEQFISYLSTDDEVLYYGYVDYSEIKTKSEIESIPELGVFINSQLKKLEEAIDFNQPIFYALKSIDLRGRIFFALKDVNKMKSLLDDVGLFSESEDGFRFFELDEFLLGFNDEFGVLDYNGDSDSFKEEVIAFVNLEAATQEEVYRQVIETKTDILLASRLDIVINDLVNSENNPEKIESLLKELKNSQGLVAINFEKGKATLDIEINGVAENLQQKLDGLFDAKHNAEIVKYLGQNSNDMAFIASLNLEALESFVLDYFMTPEQLKDYYKNLYKSYGENGLLIGGLTGESITNIADGKFGVSLDYTDGSAITEVLGIPGVRYYLGLGKDKQNVFDLISTLSEGDKMTDLGSGFYQYNDDVLKIEDNAILIQNDTDEKFVIGPLKKIKAKNFTKSPVSLYLNAESYYKTNLEEGIEESYFGIAPWEKLDYLTLELDSRAVKLNVFFKNQKDNVLKVLKDQILGEMSE